MNPSIFAQPTVFQADYSGAWKSFIYVIIFIAIVAIVYLYGMTIVGKIGEIGHQSTYEDVMGKSKEAE